MWLVLGLLVHTHGSTLNYVTGNRFQLSLRNAVQADLKQVATLCAEVFEGPFDWYQFVNQKRAIQGYYEQLSKRHQLVTDGYKRPS